MEEATVGIREFKARLSRYLRRVKAGETVLITERGKPVGRVVPVQPGAEERTRTLTHLGMLAWDGHHLQALTPPARLRRHPTVADLLLEDRR
ncbi:type II toxin-antitoxin system prevent-host-death family antitoxin [Litorilinea aerophila]|uniref:Antitoxin n=1 Tax=Litorilinea aerophila TaxID=1204385 RepID=A0A540VJ28_9CHLR|nr:type II toxin-antitoxin system prevent-host-death family antitoxin [Litorilinea aerophila]MCC9075618.1 type II toxin-antitoxin system prevent-host-death family antitoxin [Litorilinea aerophila]OUC07337.1 hypothetical protein RY27_15480 [Litorilinea aerophila]GIV79174.1 MAG: hypothetical protein KatS3mg050_3568 [Litorilinea sp.]